MLPPHRPFVQKIVKRRSIRRSPHETLVEVPGGSADGHQEAGGIARRGPHRLKPALKVLEQTPQE